MEIQVRPAILRSSTEFILCSKFVFVLRVYAETLSHATGSSRMTFSAGVVSGE
jgi:hypothetical protein